MVDEITHHVLREWLADERRVVVAILVETIGSAPLNAGAMMLFDEVGHIEGSVTGGCVEGALAEEAQLTLVEQRSPRVLTFGISDEVAGDVGLMCGGTVRIFLAELKGHASSVWQSALSAATSAQPVGVATVITGPHAGHVGAVIDEHAVGTDVADGLRALLAREVIGALRSGTSTLRRYGLDGAMLGEGVEIFVHVFGRRPRLIIIGATDFSVAVASFARELGYVVTICDAREAFLKSQRFAAFAEVVRQWPDEYLRSQTFDGDDVIVVFSHDPKFDEPALIAALESGAEFVGAMGSRKTVADRKRRLRVAGVSEEELERIVMPLGLDLGAATPAETAVSILAEVLIVRSGRSGKRLGEIAGRIRGGRRPQQLVATDLATNVADR